MENFEKPKIAILTIRNSYGYGGVLTCVQQVYKFCEKYFEPTVFFVNFDPKISANLKLLKFSSQVRKCNYFGMNCVEIGARWAFWEPGHYVFNLNYWREVLKDYDYFFVMSGSCICAYPLVLLNKKFALWIATAYQDDRSERLKTFSFFRYLIDKIASKKMEKIEKEILKRAAFIWALSKNTKDRVEEIIQQKRDNLMICNFPIEAKTFEFNGTKNIIAVGRFADPRKNIQMLLRVFEKIYQNVPQTKLYIIGSKPADKILGQFADLDFFENVIFTGSISLEQIEDYYKKCCLMLLTSYQEGLGIVGLEAFSRSIPVIATDCGGTKDYIIDDFNGYLVKINDDNAMVKKALHLLLSDEIRLKMSKNASEFVLQNFSYKKIHSIFKIGLIKVYPELAELFEKSDLNKQVDVLDLPEDVLNL